MDRYARGYDERYRGFYDRPRSDTYRPNENYRSDRDYSRDDRSGRLHPGSRYSSRSPSRPPSSGSGNSGSMMGRNGGYGYAEPPRGYYQSSSRGVSPPPRSRSPPRRSSYNYYGPPPPRNSYSSYSSRRSPSPVDYRRDSYDQRSSYSGAGNPYPPSYYHHRGSSSSSSPASQHQSYRRSYGGPPSYVHSPLPPSGSNQGPSTLPEDSMRSSRDSSFYDNNNSYTKPSFPSNPSSPSAIPPSAPSQHYQQPPSSYNNAPPLAPPPKMDPVVSSSTPSPTPPPVFRPSPPTATRLAPVFRPSSPPSAPASAMYPPTGPIATASPALIVPSSTSSPAGYFPHSSSTYIPQGPSRHPRPHHHHHYYPNTAPQRQRPVWAAEQEKEMERLLADERKNMDEETKCLAAVRKGRFDLEVANWETSKLEHQLALVQKQWKESGMDAIVAGPAGYPKVVHI